MPNFDGTGPNEKGPKTGKQMGKCEGAQPIRKGCGPCGRRMRKGFGRRFFNSEEQIKEE